MPVTVWSIRSLPYMEISLTVGGQHKISEKLVKEEIIDCYCSSEFQNNIKNKYIKYEDPPTLQFLLDRKINNNKK